MDDLTKPTEPIEPPQPPAPEPEPEPEPTTETKPEPETPPNNQYKVDPPKTDDKDSFDPWGIFV